MTRYISTSPSIGYFVEISFGISLSVSEVDKIDTIAELSYPGRWHCLLQVIRYRDRARSDSLGTASVPENRPHNSWYAVNQNGAGSSGWITSFTPASSATSHFFQEVDYVMQLIRVDAFNDSVPVETAPAWNSSEPGSPAIILRTRSYLLRPSVRNEFCLAFLHRYSRSLHPVVSVRKDESDKAARSKRSKWAIG